MSPLLKIKGVLDKAHYMLGGVRHLEMSDDLSLGWCEGLHTFLLIGRLYSKTPPKECFLIQECPKPKTFYVVARALARSNLLLNGES